MSAVEGIIAAADQACAQNGGNDGKECHEGRESYNNLEPFDRDGVRTVQ